MMKLMRKNRIIILLLLLPLSFTACDNMRPDISITVQSDYNQIIDAVSSTSRSLSDKLQLIEAAVASGFADGQAAQELLQQAVSSLSGTLSEKLAAVEAAVKSQATSLETKLGLIEAAVTQGFADDKAQQALLQAALESLSGSLSDQLAAVEGAVKSQTASLETKLALIETAVKEGLADEKAGQELLQKAVETLSGTLAERLEAIESAMNSQASSLAAKLDLIEAALENRLADTREALALIQGAVDSLSGTMDDKLAAIDTAIRSQTAGLAAKLVLIEAAVTTGFVDDAARQGLLQQAVEALSGTTDKKLAAITAAIGDQQTKLSDKLDLIEAAVKSGFAGSNEKAALIHTALAALPGTYEENLAAIDTALMNQTDSLTTKLELIEAVLQDSLARTNDVIRLVERALSTSLKDGVEEVVAVLGDIDLALDDAQNGTGVLVLISHLKTEVEKMAVIDYSKILDAIQHSIYFMGHSIEGHEYVVMGPDGLKWATCNVGASSPAETGDYFAWGEIEPYYKPGHAHDNTTTDGSNWKAGKSEGYAAASYGKNITDATLKGQDDAARQNWGGSWRMPTYQELNWLLDPNHCQRDWTDNYNGTGVRGLILTSKVENCNGNQIFLPAAGNWEEKEWHEWRPYDNLTFLCYWSSSSDSDTEALGMQIAEGIESLYITFGPEFRCFGLSVRPVSY